MSNGFLAMVRLRSGLFGRWSLRTLVAYYYESLNTLSAGVALQEDYSPYLSSGSTAPLSQAIE